MQILSLVLLIGYFYINEAIKSSYFIEKIEVWRENLKHMEYLKTNPIYDNIYTTYVYLLKKRGFYTYFYESSGYYKTNSIPIIDVNIIKKDSYSPQIICYKTYRKNYLDSRLMRILHLPIKPHLIGLKYEIFIPKGTLIEETIIE